MTVWDLLQDPRYRNNDGVLIPSAEKEYWKAVEKYGPMEDWELEIRYVERTPEHPYFDVRDWSGIDHVIHIGDVKWPRFRTVGGKEISFPFRLLGPSDRQSVEWAMLQSQDD